MEEQVVSSEPTGVESAPAAEVQEPSVDPISEPSGEDPGAEPSQPQNNFEKAFAKRLAESKEKWEQEVSQKYAGYDELTEKAKQAEAYQANLDRVARFYGFEDHASYMQALDEAERERDIKAEADRLGVPEDFIRQELQPLKSELDQLKQERQRIQQEQERIRKSEESNKAWGELFSTFPDVAKSLEGWKEGQQLPDWHTPEFEAYVNRGYTPLDSYRLTNQDRILRQREQEVLARVTERGEKSLLPNSDRPSGANFSVADMSFEDIKKLSQRARSGERVVL